MAKAKKQVKAKSADQADEKTQKLVGLTDRMIERAEPVTKLWADLWNKGIDYLFANQLAQKRRKGWKHVELNGVFPAVRQEVATLSQRRPTIRAEARANDADTLTKAKFWQGDLQYRYEKTLKMTEKSIRAALDGAATGWYIAYVYPEEKAQWDPDLGDWLYEPRVSLIKGRYFGIDPNAETVEEAQYVYCRREVDVEWAMRQWPEFAKQIEEEANPDKFDDQRAEFAARAQYDGETEGRDHRGRKEIAGKLAMLIKSGGKAGGDDSKPADDKRSRKIILTHIYFRDLETTKNKVFEDHKAEDLTANGVLWVDTPADAAPETPGQFRVQNPDAPELEHVKGRYKVNDLLALPDWPKKQTGDVDVPKFPNGRVVYRLNKLVLNPDEKNQVYERTRWPFVVGYRFPLPHIPQGLNAVEMVSMAQDWVNVTAAHLLNWLTNFCDPLWLQEPGALAGDKRLDAKPGKVIQTEAGGINKLKRMAGEALQPGVIESLQLMIRQLQDSSGIHDNAMGAPARSGQATAYEIGSLRESTQVGLSLPLMFLDAWIVGVMERVAELDRTYLKAGDAVRMAGKDFENAPVQTFMDEYRDLEFDVKLNVGSALPFDKERRKGEAVQLAGLPQFSNNPAFAEYLYDIFDIPDKQKMLEGYLNAQMAIMAQAQAQAAAKAGGTGGPSAPSEAEQPVVRPGPVGPGLPPG
jgi:hypothetical protein